MSPLSATLLGLVEGVTEFLPVSSTGHLILAASLLRLSGEAAKTFEICIQAGALIAVIGLYRARLGAMWLGLLGRDEAGRRLLLCLLVSALPAMAIGFVLHPLIEARLFTPGAVAAALALGGVVMVLPGCNARPSTSRGQALEALTLRQAAGIGGIQCLSLWPGTSRAMVTMVAGMWLGLPTVAAAEYSFLLALPTLGAATLFAAAKGGRLLLEHAGWLSILCGFVTAALVAALSIRGLIQYLTRRGLAVFGWYRLGLAALVWWMMV